MGQSKKQPLDAARVPGSSTTSTIPARERTDIEQGDTPPTEDAPIVAASLANHHANAFEKHRNGLGKVAHNLRDEPATKGTKLPQGGQAPGPFFDIDGLSGQNRGGTHSGIDEMPEQAKAGLEKMRGAVRTLLECLGEDPNREGLLSTPSRYANALLSLTKGYQVNIKDIVNNAIFNEGHDEMVIVGGIEVHSMCEHHLLPFSGKMHIGYIPSGRVIGLSKLPRIADMFAQRLQIQERLTKQVAQAIMDILSPQGVAVVMESCHMCMVMRGVEKTGTTTITSCVLGCFQEKNEKRDEFMSLLGVAKT